MRRLWLICGVIGLAALVGLSTSPAWAVAWLPDGNTDLGRPGDDPVAAGSYTYDVGTATHTIEGGGSDVWGNGEFCHYAYKLMSGSFWIESEVEWVNRTGNWGDMDQWVKGGLMLRNDVDTGAGNEKEVNTLMAVLRPDRTAASLQWRTTETGGMTSDTKGYGVVPQKVALNVWHDPEGDALIEAFVDLGGGAGWQPHGNARWALNLNDPVYAGLFVCAHNNDGRLETAHFRSVEILPAQTPAGPLPRKPHTPGDPVADPEGVEPVMGGWGVVEVVDNGRMNNVDDAYRSLEDGGGTRHSYDLMGALNINDHEGNAANFGGDVGYGVVYEGIKGAGGVNDLALLARGIVDIPVEDDWTFYARSDDGVELTVDGQPLIASEQWSANNFGTIHLTAGWHSIQVVHRERSGGANVEVAAARGETTNLELFRLIGSGDPGAPSYTVWVPGLDDDADAGNGYGLVTIESTTPGYNNPKAESRDLALQQIANARLESPPEIHAALADVVNHNDPDTGGSGMFGGDLAFPNDAPGGQDDFATIATGYLVIPADGTYYIGYNSDDGMALQIEGGVWEAVVDTAAGGIIDPLDPSWMVTDAWTGNSRTVGRITLTAGSYPFTAVSYEGGGGAHMEMFGSTKQGNYYLITSGPGQEIVVPAAADALDLVPEPGSLGLLAVMGLLGLVGLAWRRRS